MTSALRSPDITSTGKHPGPDEMKPAAPFRFGEKDQPGEQQREEDEDEARVRDLLPTDPVAVGDVPQDGSGCDRRHAQEQPSRKTIHVESRRLLRQQEGEQDHHQYLQPFPRGVPRPADGGRRDVPEEIREQQQQAGRDADAAPRRDERPSEHSERDQELEGAHEDEPGLHPNRQHQAQDRERQQCVHDITASPRPRRRCGIRSRITSA